MSDALVLVAVAGERTLIKEDSCSEQVLWSFLHCIMFLCDLYGFPKKHCKNDL